eukprot:gene43738-58290_t
MGRRGGHRRGRLRPMVGSMSMRLSNGRWVVMYHHTPRQRIASVAGAAPDFRAPERRTADILALSAETLADAAAVSEADARARYEEVKAQRFTTPETRTIQQIVFPNAEEAQAARARIELSAAISAWRQALGLLPQ